MQQFERDAIASRTNNFVATQWLERGKPSHQSAIKTASGSSGCRSDSQDILSQLIHYPKWCLLLLLLLLLLLDSVIRLLMVARGCKCCRACLTLLHDDNAESTKAEASHWVLSGLHTESVTWLQVYRTSGLLWSINVLLLCISSECLVSCVQMKRSHDHSLKICQKYFDTYKWHTPVCGWQATAEGIRSVLRARKCKALPLCCVNQSINQCI